MRLVNSENFRQDASADPRAGEVHENGKPIWTYQQAGFNLSRTNQQWDVNNYGELDDGVLNFGFWDLESLMTSYYVNADGTIAFNEAYYYDAFVPFSAEQMELARDAIGMWDDLIAVRFEETAVEDADITFGNTDDGPFSGAYAYLPFGDVLDDIYSYYYGFEEVGRLGGDVWINTQETANFSNLEKGYYANFAITHELGHALGLSHGGDYNATNPDGTPNSPDYAGDAYFFQDSNQYTIMSYFGAEETGGMWIDWRSLTYGYAATPMVHDIVSVQQIYGVDTTTRTGNTVYGFNSNADRAAFRIGDDDTFMPIFTIWDAAGNDTLDLSGYDTPSVIDLNPGAYSSAGGTVSSEFTREQVDAARAELGRAPVSDATWDFYQEFREQYGIETGLYKDNIAIAYGAIIENAFGGGGDDTITGNSAANIIKGNGGNDTIAAGNGIDVVSLGAGNDVFIAEQGTKASTKTGSWSWDVITDFNGNGDKIDLSGLGDFTFIGTNANKKTGDVSYKSYTSIQGAESALGIDIDGRPGAAGVSGPVTIVYANTQNGGSPEVAIVLLNTSSVDASDFYLT